MNIKYIYIKIITALLLVLQRIYFCYTEFDNLNIHENGIISDIIPNCVFGVESVSYFLYTRDKLYGKEVHTNDEYIPMRANRTVAFLIHGFISEANNSNYFELITAWLKKEDINIFSLNWADAACRGGFSFVDLLAYNSAVNNVPIVGKYLTNFTVKLVEKYKINVNEILIIGHSLGAHVAGFSGKNIQEVLKQKYKQIIGLDPAGPEFMNRQCADRLCKSDAAFVQIFHTSYLAGIHIAIGDDDFYFNGGHIQPGCILIACSHSRAVVYLTMTLLYPPCFIGIPWKIGSESILNWKECNSNICTHPGLNTIDKIAKGTYYVSTIDTKPFCTL